MKALLRTGLESYLAALQGANADLGQSNDFAAIRQRYREASELLHTRVLPEDEFWAAVRAITDYHESGCAKHDEPICIVHCIDPDDPTPWCLGCGARTREQCDCGPIAENN